MPGAAGAEALFRWPPSPRKPLIAGAAMAFRSVFVVDNGLACAGPPLEDTGPDKRAIRAPTLPTRPRQD